MNCFYCNSPLPEIIRDHLEICTGRKTILQRQAEANDALDSYPPARDALLVQDDE